MINPLRKAFELWGRAHVEPAPDIKFQAERLDDCLSGLMPLFQHHYTEIAKNKNVLHLNPDLELYRTLEMKERLLIVTARHDSKLVGYFVWFIARHPHYRHVGTAEEDVHFLLKRYRGRGIGTQLIQTACDIAVERGCKYLRVREKIGHEHPNMMKSLGFVPMDITYTKAIGDGDAG